MEEGGGSCAELIARGSPHWGGLEVCGQSVPSRGGFLREPRRDSGMREKISSAQRGAEYSPPTSALRFAECGEIWEGPIVPSCGGFPREPQSDREMEGGSSTQRGAGCSPPSALRGAECKLEGPIVPSRDGFLREPHSDREGPIVPSRDGFLREPHSDKEMEESSGSDRPGAESSSTTPSTLRFAEGWDERERRAEEEADRFLEMIAQAAEEAQGEINWLLDVEVVDGDENLFASDYHRQQKIKSEVYRLVCNMFPSLATEDPALEERMSDLASEAWRRCDQDYGESEALKWAKDFVLDYGIMEQDEADLQRHGGDFIALVQERLAGLSANRISEDRILQSISANNPEIDKLLALARGVPVLTAEGFVPNGLPVEEPLPRLTSSYVRVASAVNRLLAESVLSKGLGILVPKDVARAAVPDLHVSYLGWTPKWGKQCGRPLNDGSRTAKDRDWLPLKRR